MDDGKRFTIFRGVRVDSGNDHERG
jgi:hypothetical protein